MNLPSIKHPKISRINGILIQLFSYEHLTNPQASKLAQVFYGSRKFKKSEQGKIQQVILTTENNFVKFL
jgi:hypothetical protein